MATIPVYSPAVPFLGLVPAGLRPGSMVRIKGIINNHGERCQINIQTGAALNPRDDVVLHISIRPNEHAIVRNTLQSQVWGAEERHGGCPIQYGIPFDLLVLAEVNQYKIAINGNHFCMFSHRLAVHLAKFVSISGGCVIHSITSEMDSAGGQAPPYPGNIGVGPHPPPYVPNPPGGGHIGFMPIPPPMPPPPPYTPTPGFSPGGTGQFPGGIAPHVPPYPGYPHQPGYPAATPYSPQPPTASSAPSAPSPGSGSVYPSLVPAGQPKPMKQTIISGMQQTKDFLQEAVFGKTTATPSYPQQLPAAHYPSNQPHHNAYPQQQPSGGQYPLAPYPATAMGQVIMTNPPSSGLQSTGVGLASSAQAPGTAADVLSHLPKKQAKKSKKLLKKYGAGAGLVGLGGYAVGRKHRKRSGSNSSSSSSD